MQLNPGRDSWMHLNIDDNVEMMSWPEEIPHSSVANLSLDGTHVNCDVCMNGRSWGRINMRHPYAIAAWKTHICTDGHKDGMVAQEARDLRLALGDDVRTKPGDQLALGSFFTTKGKGSRFDRPV